VIGVSPETRLPLRERTITCADSIGVSGLLRLIWLYRSLDLIISSSSCRTLSSDNCDPGCSRGSIGATGPGCKLLQSLQSTMANGARRDAKIYGGGIGLGTTGVTGGCAGHVLRRQIGCALVHGVPRCRAQPEHGHRQRAELQGNRRPAGNDGGLARPLSKGHTLMPDFLLSPQERDALVAYILSLR
jgi:hypothetical protein